MRQVGKRDESIFNWSGCSCLQQHTPEETQMANTAKALYREIIAKMSEPKTVEKLIDAICNLKYHYGVGNGT